MNCKRWEMRGDRLGGTSASEVNGCGYEDAVGAEWCKSEDVAKLEALTREFAEIVRLSYRWDESDGHYECDLCRISGATSRARIAHKPNCPVAKAEAYLKENP